MAAAGCSLQPNLTIADPLGDKLLQTLAIMLLGAPCVYYLAAKCIGDGAPEQFPDTPRRSKLRDPLFSGAVLWASDPDDIPLLLVPAISATLDRLLGQERARCLSALEELPDPAEVRETCGDGTNDPKQAISLFLGGQLQVLDSIEEAAKQWRKRQDSSGREAIDSGGGSPGHLLHAFSAILLHPLRVLWHTRALQMLSPISRTQIV